MADTWIIAYWDGERYSNAISDLAPARWLHAAHNRGHPHFVLLGATKVDPDDLVDGCLRKDHSTIENKIFSVLDTPWAWHLDIKMQVFQTGEEVPLSASCAPEFERSTHIRERLQFKARPTVADKDWNWGFVGQNISDVFFTDAGFTAINYMMAKTGLWHKGRLVEQ